MFCTKTRNLENKDEIKSVTSKYELDIIEKRLRDAKNDCGITIVPKYNFCSKDMEWVLLVFKVVYAFHKVKILS